MPPLPSLESLTRVNTALAQEQRRANNPRRHLQVLLESLRSESLSVRCASARVVSGTDLGCGRQRAVYAEAQRRLG